MAAATIAHNAIVLNQNQLSAALISMGDVGTKSDVRDLEAVGQQSLYLCSPRWPFRR